MFREVLGGELRGVAAFSPSSWLCLPTSWHCKNILEAHNSSLHLNGRYIIKVYISSPNSLVDVCGVSLLKDVRVEKQEGEKFQTSFPKVPDRLIG